MIVYLKYLFFVRMLQMHRNILKIIVLLAILHLFYHLIFFNFSIHYIYDLHCYFYLKHYKIMIVDLFFILIIYSIIIFILMFLISILIYLLSINSILLSIMHRLDMSLYLIIINDLLYVNFGYL